MLSDDDDDMLDETINENLEKMKDIYKSSDNFGQLVILSLASQQYSKVNIIDYFECSKCKVDNARKRYSLTEVISIPENKKHKPSKLELRKCDHFLDFIFHNGLIQDAAYGTTNLTYSSGDTQTIPHAVITAKYKHIMAYYLQFCQDNNYEPLSESSLYRILKELKPSQRKSLAGLDNTTADRLNGFSILADIAKKYFAGNKGIVDNLEKGKQYIKIGYPQHCVDHSTCASHCISFALSDTTDPNLCKERQCGSENHNSFCDQCSNLYSTIDQITDLVKESQLKNKDDLLYDTSNAKNNILKWTFHIIRHVQQNKAKTNVFDLLSETTGKRDYPWS